MIVYDKYLFLCPLNCFAKVEELSSLLVRRSARILIVAWRDLQKVVPGNVSHKHRHRHKNKAGK